MEQIENEIKIKILLQKAFHQMLLIFKENWYQLTGQKWKNGITGEQFDQLSKSKMYFSEPDKIERNRINSGNPSEWDITLITKLCLSLFKHQMDPELLANIVKIKNLRNEFFHDQNFNIDSNLLMKQLGEFMVKIGIDKSEIDYIVETKFEDLVKDEKKLAEEIEEEEEEDGNMLLTQSRYLEAIQLYSKSLQKENLSSRTISTMLCNRSQCYNQLNQLEQNKKYFQLSIVDAENAKLLNPLNSKVYYKLADLYLNDNQLDKALVNIRIAKVLDKNDEDIAVLKDKIYGKYLLADESLVCEIIPLCKQQKNKLLMQYMRETYKNQESDIDMQSFIDENLSKYAGNTEVLLGDIFYFGTQLTKIDFPTSLYYYFQSIRLNNCYGYYKLGNLYLIGNVVPKDIQKGIQILLMATEMIPDQENEIEMSGYQDACHLLATFYETGIYVLQDKQQANTWEQRATLQRTTRDSQQIKQKM